MPNWVKNVISISGDEENIKKVAEKIIVNDEYLNWLEERNKKCAKEFKLRIPELNTISFNRLIPVPTNIFQLSLSHADEEKYGADYCWYQWNINHWGTKWDASDVIANVSKTFISLCFDTAWTFPNKYIEALAKVCADNGCYMYGSFADEDFGGMMGEFELDKDNNLLLKFIDMDPTLYEQVWGISLPEM